MMLETNTVRSVVWEESLVLKTAQVAKETSPLIFNLVSVKFLGYW